MGTGIQHGDMAQLDLAHFWYQELFSIAFSVISIEMLSEKLQGKY